MRRFADTFFFLAMLDKADSAHIAVTRHAAENDDVIVTTRWVLAEVANATARFPDLRAAAGDRLHELETDNGAIIVQGSELYTKGLQRYRQRADKTWSLTDCISFIVMEEEKLMQALTADRHFAQAGFLPLYAGES